MDFKKLIMGIFTGLSIFLIIRYSNSHSEKKRSIGILQTASHPALDACRQEFINTFAQDSEVPYNFIVKNGEGSLINLHTAAQELHLDSSIELLYVIATPALQIAASIEKERPIIFAAVTDPSQVIDKNQTNVTGISDAIDAHQVISDVIVLVPQAQKVGLIYNPSEINSTLSVKEFETHLDDKNLSVLHVPITSEAEVSQAVINALSQIDVLLAPTDNLVANTAPLIAQLAYENNKPFIVSDLKLITTSPVAALGVSYETCGKEAAEYAHTILSNPGHPLPDYKKTQMQKGLINVPVFKDLKLTYNENLTKIYNFFPSHATLDQ